MNKCDLEETRKVIEKIVVDALRDKDGWVECIAEGTDRFSSRYRGTSLTANLWGQHWFYELDGKNTGMMSAEGDPAVEHLTAMADAKWNNKECERLLKLVSTFKHHPEASVSPYSAISPPANGNPKGLMRWALFALLGGLAWVAYNSYSERVLEPKAEVEITVGKER